MPTTPQVRFFRNPTGGRVAYSVHGEGPPLICVAWWVSHVEGDWQQPGFRRFFEALADRNTVIRYDRLGAGLSDRDREEVDLNSEVQTLASLIAHLELEQVTLFAIACAGPPAIVYAAQHPEKVAKLVFWGSYVRGEDVGDAATRDAMQALVRANWGIGSTTLSNLFAPKLDAGERDALSRSQRNAASAEMSSRLLGLSFDQQAADEAHRLVQPALVLHRKGDRTIPFAAGRELAAHIADSSLCALDGNAHLPWYEDVDAASSAILEFLAGEGEREPVQKSEVATSCSLARQGDVWRLYFDGEEVFVPDARGISDLAHLLEQPGKEIHVTTLWTGAQQVELHQGENPTLDDLALASYRDRLRDIEAELAECELQQRAERAEALHSEKVQLARELRAAVGLGGRKRELKDVTERARKAVSARIRASLGKIADVHAPLGVHLEKSVATGTYCSYCPKADRSWQVSR